MSQRQPTGLGPFWGALWRSLSRMLLMVCLALLGLQLYFGTRIAAMAFVAPQSTAFERSEIWRLLHQDKAFHWSQSWRDYPDISRQLKRAVLVSEDDGFANHDGFDWDALKKAWDKNNKVQARADKAGISAPITIFGSTNSTPATNPSAKTKKTSNPKVVGGSTITQQLAKNLFLSGERTLLRKSQEFIITATLEACLSKERILEIYLNSVELGEGIFGAQAGAQAYFQKNANQLSAYESARLAVMLPRPKYFEKLGQSEYLANRASVIVSRMEEANLP